MPTNSWSSKVSASTSCTHLWPRARSWFRADRRIEPTVVEYDAIAETGARNLNFILYATYPQGLLETTGSCTGSYAQYHVFSNCIITYLPPPLEGKSGTFSDTRCRIRFRTNPGFNLLTERLIETKQDVARRRRITCVLDNEGNMRLYVDGQLIRAFHDKTPLRSGYHGFRTWNSNVKYANFRVYSIQGQRPKEPETGSL